MSNASMHLSLPYLQGGQAQKHVTHNEALRKLDLAVQLSVLAQADTPPVAPAEGDRYVVGTAPTGDWAGQPQTVAQYAQSAWAFTEPAVGWLAYDQDIGGQIVFDGGGWGAVLPTANMVPELGVNTPADGINRFSVSSDAVLLSHDGGGHQVKVNKASASETGSVLFQTGWSGRAEMGLTGSDDFEVKVSPDGTTFHTALSVSRQDGAVSFPNSSVASFAFVASSAGGLVTNATGLLGAGVNVPTGASFDAAQSPNMSGALSFAGHFSGAVEFPESIAIDPNRVYRLTSYLRQGSVPGDWSAFAQEERHSQYIGLRCYDVDGLPILSQHHARYRHGGVDSLTVLTQPLAPGDTSVHVAQAAGWNETESTSQRRGLVIFGYSSATGQSYENYSRIEEEDLFDLGGVNKSTGVVTLNKALPTALGNPGDVGGVWPVGTRIANRTNGFHDKFAFCQDVVLPAVDQWHQLSHAIGGVDLSGRNVATNFAPGTATLRVVVMMNYTNRVGGFAGYADTGTAQQVWLSGLAITADSSAQAVLASDGARDVYGFAGNVSTGSVSMGLLMPQIEAV